CMQYRHIPPTF
nr:immunoglobulin light chain junction region [Macaca mulatta]MOX51875.1 immunoglobulin light chain junction region [Macaca mulatta]MOX51878.1 immunoglobulin light chain junction region [Macaca mulatta]MOX52041.1 immunoglobulin light chain junction region [Macaca mulatta]MOX52192.1 immunoglobulin light chain junction region [Macaca mulatta]